MFNITIFDLIFALVPAILAITALYVIRSMNKKNAKTKYDIELHMIRMDYERKYYEDKIYELTKKLNSDLERNKDINHLLFNTPEINNDIKFEHNINSNEFIKSMNIKENDTKIDPRLIFVLTPFNDAFSEDFFQIRNILSDFNFNCIRGDEQNITGNILPHIIKKIIQSRVVIANITGRNPNVFYELGIAHALNKPTIIISKNESDIPFDIKSQRIIFYKTKEDLKSSLKESLLKILN